MVGNISQGSGNGLFDMLRSQRNEGTETLEVSSPEAPAKRAPGAADASPAPSRAASANMMAQNFASAEREESRYITARKTAFQTDGDMANRQNSILNAGLAELNSLSDKDSTNYAVRSLIGKKAARRMLREQQQSAAEESQRNLKEIKEKIEEKAQEASAPKDENGNPIETPSVGNAAEAAPAPEISSGSTTPLPASEVSVAPEAAAPDPAIAATPAPAPTPAPSAPSIDIVV